MLVRAYKHLEKEEKIKLPLLLHIQNLATRFHLTYAELGTNVLTWSAILYHVIRFEFLFFKEILKN